MSDLTTGRRWRLTSDGQIEPEDGQPVGTFTAQEWRAQQWPPCPVCGAQGEPEQVDIHGYADRFPVLIPGAWECPNDCDPRPALRGEAG
ncbi:hypothetical protein [Actinomadura litoris]|uniref:hypothetical protein n=1 Tax=Actinomadura litoris TaxID=2678616 RepID=UPI001FA7CBD7|nr:hypothetical protein [Actinomadura litoris]